MKRKGRVVLADLAWETESLIRLSLTHADFATLRSGETITEEVMAVADLILVGVEDDTQMARRVARWAADSESRVPIYLLVAEGFPESELEGFESFRRLASPLDISYLKGILDACSSRHDQLEMLGEEQTRVQALYEISSALLKITKRNEISPALDHTLPNFFGATMTLLTLPADEHPIIYFQTNEPVGERTIRALKEHFQEAWQVLRPGQKTDWHWLESLISSGGENYGRGLSASSFFTTPITRGNRTEGFFTVLPSLERPSDESFLQSFFVVGDLLSVLLHNLHLREQLEARATTDGLTGLLNRQTLFEALDRECRRSARYGQPVSVVMMDLDNFKHINDHFGHQAGDEGLRHISRKITLSVRESDIAGRCGGEEFIVVLPSTDLDGAVIWAERLREDFAKDPLRFNGDLITITASLGVARGSGEGVTVDALVARADAALYRAKREGRNCVRFDERADFSQESGMTAT